MEVTNNIGLHSNYNLARLSKYLNYHITTFALFIASWFGAIFLLVAALGGLIFAPYMLYVLYQENKKGWILFFAIIVIVPFILLIIISFLYPSFKLTIVILITLGLFFLYCFLLRFEVNDWIREERAKNEYILEKQKRNQDLDNFMDEFK